MKILITGANGFVGCALLKRLQEQPEFSLCASVRRPTAEVASGVQRWVTGDLCADTLWTSALDGVDVVVHLAARVHILRNHSTDPLSAYRRTNVEGTLALAQRAVEAGARRFIYLSSVKVHGEETTLTPFRCADPPAPVDNYGLSKLEAEQGLARLAAATGIEVVIIRPPLVYGPGVKANFQRMMRWICAGVPLPLAAVDNRRSLVAVENLVDLIATCVAHPAAAGQVFLVSDGEDMSTPELLRRVGSALDKPARLFPVPVSWLTAAATMLGGDEIARRLCGSLQVDSTPIRELLGWQPPASVDRALRATAVDFLGRQPSRLRSVRP